MTATSPPACRRIFVVGVPRSGTTLVQSLLAAHDELISFTESHFFDRHFWLPLGLGPVLTRDPGPRLRQFLEENGLAEDSLKENGAADRDLAASWDSGSRVLLPLRTRRMARQLLAVLDMLARRRDKAGWIEKTPRHLRYMPWLQRLGAGRIDVVHVIRAGLQTVASLHKASAQWERHYDVAECVQRWNDDVAFSLARRDSPRNHFVVYERLTDHPESELQRLCHALDLEWEPEMQERHEASARAVVTDDETWKANVGRPIRRSQSAHHNLTRLQRDQARAGLRDNLYARVLSHLGGAG